MPVNPAACLSGKPVIAIACGDSHSSPCAADGTLAAWGYNYFGQLGNNTTSNSTASRLAVTTNALQAGERIVAVRSAPRCRTWPGAGGRSPPPPAVQDTRRQRRGRHRRHPEWQCECPGHAAATVAFEYGLTTSYGTTVAATPVCGHRHRRHRGERATSAACFPAPPIIIGWWPPTPAARCTGEDMTFTTGTQSSAGRPDLEQWHAVPGILQLHAPVI